MLNLGRWETVQLSGEIQIPHVPPPKRHPYDQWSPDARALDLVGDKWTLLIVRDLVSGPRRFVELQRVLPGISTEQLRSRLNRMVADEMLTRKRYREVPPRVDYELTSLGETLLDMGRPDEAIINFNAALKLSPKYPAALMGLGKAYLKTGRPDLAASPLALDYQINPNDPKLLMVIGVADDFIGQHVYAQARYQQGLRLAPGDHSLILNLALSLALTEKYDQAIALLRPVAYAAGASPRERQTLALIYGLKGDTNAARQVAQIDLDAASVTHNLAFYETLRRLSPDARSRAILSVSAVVHPPT